MLSQEQIDFFLTKAYNAALCGGACILEIYNGGEDMEIDIKTDNTPITLADRCSHDIIKDYLSQTRIPLMSEEGRDLLFEERCHWDLYWLVDPLDGTKEFIKGNGEFTVNIALMYNNEPVIGIVYVPYIRRMYHAVKGQGAFLHDDMKPDLEAELTLEEIMRNIKPLPLFEKRNDPIRIAISRSHNTDETFKIVDQIKIKHPNALVVEQGSSYKLCLLAEALVDIYPRTSPTYEWDIAAGEIILKETGGVLQPIGEGVPDIMLYNKKDLICPYFIARSRHCKE